MPIPILRLAFAIVLTVASVAMRADGAQAATPGMSVDCHSAGGMNHRSVAPKIDCAAFCTAMLPDCVPADATEYRGTALVASLPAEPLKAHLLEVETPPPKWTSPPFM